MYVGIDLAGSSKRPTGFCIMDKKLRIKTKIVFSNDEILKEIDKIKPKVIAIDAPLSLPKGRKSLEVNNGIHFRKADRELLKMKIKFFPITLGPMRMLTKRGIKLKKILEKRGYKVIEVYPGGAQDLLGIPRKSKGRKKLVNGLKKIGIKGIKGNESLDELDAITCAYVAKLYDEKKFIALGEPKEGLIIMPKPKRKIIF